MNHKSKPWPLLVSVYITQYVGLAFIMSAAFAILRESGVALDKLALINLVALPLLGKVLYAPFVDTFRLFFQGQYRSWLFVAQSLMTILLLICSFLDIQRDFSVILVIIFLYSFFRSVQDVAIDALACKIFIASERQFANSIQYSSNLIGNIIGGGLLLIIYPWIQWQGALWILAILTAISNIQIWFYQEPDSHSQNAQIKITNQFNNLGQQIKVFISQYKIWFFLLFIYPIGFTAVFGILNPLLVDAKWTLADIGFATKIFGSIVGIFSAFLSTLLINKFNRKWALIVLTLLQGAATLLFIPLTLGYTNKWMVYIAIFAYFAVNPGLLSALSTLIMDRASLMPAKATIFSLQFSLIVFMGYVHSSVGLALAEYMGYTAVVVITFICALIVTALTWKLLPNHIEESKA